jgi:hypothetical protein
MHCTFHFHAMMGSALTFPGSRFSMFFLAAPWAVLGLSFLVAAIRAFRTPGTGLGGFPELLLASASLWLVARVLSSYIQVSGSYVVVRGVFRTRVLDRTQIRGVVEVPRWYGGTGLDLVLADGRRIGVPAPLVSPRRPELARLRERLSRALGEDP